MRHTRQTFVWGLVAAGVLALGAPAGAQLNLISSFNPAEIGSLSAIGFDPVGDQLYVYEQFNANIHLYDRNGVFQGTVANAGDAGNDSDIEFADEAINIAGTNVPANSLLLIENENAPPRIIAANKTTGAALATQAFSTGIGQLVGGAYHHDSNTFFMINWNVDLIFEVDPSNGTTLNSFGFGGPPAWDAFFGDVDVLKADGLLYLVSSTQNTIRVMDPLGTFLGDIDVNPFGIGGMSGIAFDDLRGEAWISSTNGTVYQVGGFEAFVPGPIIPEPATLTLLGLGGLALARRRRMAA